MNTTTPTPKNKTAASHYPAPVRFSKLSFFSTITVQPFWIVPFCLISGIILFLLRGFVLEIEKFYSVFNPLIIPLLIVGLGLIVLRRVFYTDPRTLFNIGNTVGYVFLYTALFLILLLTASDFWSFTGVSTMRPSRVAISKYSGVPTC